MVSGTKTLAAGPASCEVKLQWIGFNALAHMRCSVGMISGEFGSQGNILNSYVSQGISEIVLQYGRVHYPVEGEATAIRE